MDFSHRPIVLYHASMERIDESRRCFDDHDYVLCAYLSGVAVECVLQAIALSGGAAHDARHDLNHWLAKCPSSLQMLIKGDAGTEWSFLLSLWDNGLRYYSEEGYLGYLRQKKANRGISGGPQTVVRQCTRQINSGADIIHKKGLAQWVNSTKK